MMSNQHNSLTSCLKITVRLTLESLSALGIKEIVNISQEWGSDAIHTNIENGRGLHIL